MTDTTQLHIYKIIIYSVIIIIIISDNSHKFSVNEKKDKKVHKSTIKMYFYIHTLRGITIISWSDNTGSFHFSSYSKGHIYMQEMHN